jgi:hypothetical protein
VTAIPSDALNETTLAGMGVDPDQPVLLGALTFLDEGDEVTVGRVDIDSYCVLPADGAALLRKLVDGSSPREAADWYLQRYGEPVDVAEFLEAMAELNFLAPAPVEDASGPVPWQRLGMAVFSRPAWLGYAALLIAAAAVMARHHDLLPRTHHMYFTRYATPVLLLAVFGQFPLVLIHEGFHALAGRRVGVRSRLRISRRLNVLVAETSLDGLVVVPRAKRYLPILAGMLADLIVIAALTVIAAILRHPGGGQSLAGGICLALAYTTLLRLIWQFYFFLQTDLYQLLVTALGCIDLHRTACRVIANRWHQAVRQPHRLHDESEWHSRDRVVARWYCWVLVAGYAISLASFVLAILPLLYHLFATVLSRLSSGRHLDLDALADSVTFLLLTAAQLAAVGYLMLRERRQRLSSPSAHLVG